MMGYLLAILSMFARGDTVLPKSSAAVIPHLVSYYRGSSLLLGVLDQHETTIVTCPLQHTIRAIPHGPRLFSFVFARGDTVLPKYFVAVIPYLVSYHRGSSLLLDTPRPT